MRTKSREQALLQHAITDHTLYALGVFVPTDRQMRKGSLSAYYRELQASGGRDAGPRKSKRTRGGTQSTEADQEAERGGEEEESSFTPPIEAAQAAPVEKRRPGRPRKKPVTPVVPEDEDSYTPVVFDDEEPHSSTAESSSTSEAVYPTQTGFVYDEVCLVLENGRFIIEWPQHESYEHVEITRVTSQLPHGGLLMHYVYEEDGGDGNITDKAMLSLLSRRKTWNDGSDMTKVCRQERPGVGGSIVRIRPDELTEIVVKNKAKVIIHGYPRIRPDFRRDGLADRTNLTITSLGGSVIFSNIEHGGTPMTLESCGNLLPVKTASSVATVWTFEGAPTESCDANDKIIRCDGVAVVNFTGYLTIKTGGHAKPNTIRVPERCPCLIVDGECHPGIADGFLYSK